MKLIFSIILSCSSVLTASTPVAIDGSPGAGWQPVTSASFANGFSLDAASASLINWATGTGAFSSEPSSPDIPDKKLEIWSFPDGSADQSVSFPPGSYKVNQLFWWSDNHPFELIGWYLVASPSGMTVLFSDSPVGQLIPFAPIQQWALYEDRGDGETNASIVSDGTLGSIGIAILRDSRHPGTIYVGFNQDSPFGDWDFQDSIVSITIIK